VVSTEVRADEAPMDRYPVDDTSKKTNCEMHVPTKIILMKVALAMCYHLDQNNSGMAVRFELAMLVSRWMQLYRGMSPSSLTSLDLKRRQHLEKYWVVSFFGIRNTSCFQA
jgi:hypothetical protein